MFLIIDVYVIVVFFLIDIVKYYFFKNYINMKINNKWFIKVNIEDYF